MTTTPSIDVDADLSRARARTAATWQQLRRGRLGDTIDTPDGPLTLAAGSYGHVDPATYDHLDNDQRVAYFESLPYAEVTLTADGRHVAPSYALDWHRGDAGPLDEWVRYERWSPRGRVAHGYIHPESRQLVQSG